MSNSVNVKFLQQVGQAPIYLYSHSGAYDMPNKVAAALFAAHLRWDDAGYATRIMLRELLADEDFSGETGGAVSTAPYAADWPTIVVDFTAGLVYLETGGREPQPFLPYAKTDHLPFDYDTVP